MPPSSSEASPSGAPDHVPEEEDRRAALRALPSVEQLAAAIDGPHHLAVAATRIEIEAARLRIAGGALPGASLAELREAVTARLASTRRGRLRPVINATGIILHTNLGRAPLAAEAAAQAALIGAGYSTLELDLETGERGSRHSHLTDLLCELSGAEAAIAVNNNAAAVMLAVAATAGGRAGRAAPGSEPGEVVIGRDQLIEIGGSFRIPEIIAASGATLVEVGTTNRVCAGDYATAIGPGTAALMRVHQSNFETLGFTETPTLAELVGLGRERGIAVIDDLGSGASEPIGDEPQVADSITTGADLACFSADKLLGGPQAGIIVGRADAIERCRRHPLARALRLDKLQIAALEATLRLRRERPEAIPAVAMMAPAGEALDRRAALMVEAIGPAAKLGTTVSRPGGGTLPAHELPGPACLLDPGELGADELLGRMRAGESPVIARISDGLIVLDPRTMSDADARAAATVAADAIA